MTEETKKEEVKKGLPTWAKVIILLALGSGAVYGGYKLAGRK
jgi:hypothetical protein